MRAVPEASLGRPNRMRRRRKRIVKPRPPLRDLMAPVECELSVPFVFLMLVRRFSNSVKAYPHSRDPAKWCFRFGTKALLEIAADGSAEWISGSPELRRDVDIIIDCARERLASPGGSPSSEPRCVTLAQ